jgi:hypothetical protein
MGHSAYLDLSPCKIVAHENNFFARKIPKLKMAFIVYKILRAL